MPIVFMVEELRSHYSKKNMSIFFTDYDIMMSFIKDSIIRGVIHKICCSDFEITDPVYLEATSNTVAFSENNRENMVWRIP